MGRMIERRAFAGCVLGLGLLCASVINAGAMNGGAQKRWPMALAVRDTFGAWQVFCRRSPPGEGGLCALVQSVAGEARPTVQLTLIVYRAQRDDRTLLRAVVPLGVLLPKGLGLRIDEENAGTAPFVKCTKSGCVAEAVLEKREIDRLKSGETAVFVIYETIDAGIGIPVSLEGFTAGYAELK